MSYDYSFWGHFSLNKTLKPEHQAYLQRFSRIRHLLWSEEDIENYPDPYREAVGLPLGENGLYFTGNIESDRLLSSKYIHYNIPSPMFSSFYCDWSPTSNGNGIEWNGNDKFRSFEKWLRFLMDHFLHPWDYELCGTVYFRGENFEHGRILVWQKNITVVWDNGFSTPIHSGCPKCHPSQMQLFWIAVSHISQEARSALEASSCLIYETACPFPLFLVGLRYHPYHRMLCGSDDLTLKDDGDISLGSSHLSLHWQGSSPLHPLLKNSPGSRLLLAHERVQEHRASPSASFFTTHPSPPLPHHWIVVGSITEQARSQLLEADCILLDLSHTPPCVALGFPYSPFDEEDYSVPDLTLEIDGDVKIHSKNLWFFLEGNAPDWGALGSIPDLKLSTFKEYYGGEQPALSRQASQSTQQSTQTTLTEEELEEILKRFPF